MGLGRFARQLGALMHKCFLVSVVRHPISFLLFVYGLPLGILALLLSIPSFLTSHNHFGIASPVAIKSLPESFSRKLVIVKPPSLGPDVDRVIDTFTKPFNKDALQFIDDDEKLLTVCLANDRGTTGCHAAISFVDSPETTVKANNSQSEHHTWQYVIRVDPNKGDGSFDATKHNTEMESVIMPLQLAVNNAITNTTGKSPETFSFTPVTEKEQAHQKQVDNVTLIGQIYTFALFVPYFFIIYRFVSLITAERESGMSQLIDAMGGGGASVARTFSWLLVFDLASLPCFIIAAVVYKKIVFPTAPLGILIAWQVLLGLAINGSTVFAASFFTKSRVSAIYVIGAFLLLSVGAQVYGFELDPLPGPEGVYVLTAIFSSSNFVFFVQQLCLWELQGEPVQLDQLPQPDIGLNSLSYHVTQELMLAFLVFHIVLYPFLSLLVERFFHGIDFRSRSFTKKVQTRATTRNVIAATTDLKKIFKGNIFKRIFSPGTVHAVDGVTLQGYKGQILCLVGPNGSGKTTTLHMMAGFTTPTAGSVNFDANASQIGICPQRNTQWEELTVREHVSLWNNIKSTKQSKAEVEELINGCDLSKKSKSKAKTLSGGQKRKLQLACMFVGGSSVCLIDECTSGLDPLSRRVIWEILLEQRSKRSIIFTTHFLDEVDVLADHIVILSKGKVKCQGPSTELKNLYGGGYRVQVPRSADVGTNVPYPSTVHQDRLVFTVPDSQTAAELSSILSATTTSGISITGPQTEDVFLRVADDVELEPTNSELQQMDKNFQMSPGSYTSFWSQVWVLFGKRFTILKRFWWPYLYVLVLPLVITPFLNTSLGENFFLTTCQRYGAVLGSGYPHSFAFTESCGSYDWCESLYIGPPSAKSSLHRMVEKDYYEVADVKLSLFDEFVKIQNSGEGFIDAIHKGRESSQGGVFLGNGSSPALLAFMIAEYGEPNGIDILNLWSQMVGETEIIVSKASLPQKANSSTTSGIIYIVFFTIIQAIYPAAFVLYPSIEKARSVRALEYTNWVRRGPLWVAYTMFDAIFVLIIAAGTTAILSVQVPWNGPAAIMFPILALYGFAAALLAYIVGHFVNGPLKSFFAVAGVGLVSFIISGAAFIAASNSPLIDDILLGTTFGLNLLFPIGNVFRAATVGINILRAGCSGDSFVSPGSIYAYGGPILYLVIQIAALLLIIIWIEGDLVLFRRNRKLNAASKGSRADGEKHIVTRSEEVESETLRVEENESDLLRTLHVDKWFGSNHAVDDVTLGLPESDVTALLGPNGAGKSTLVNLIQSQLSPDHGQVLLQGEDARARSAQKYLGVCPQFDALDMMSAREHLNFYARIKGIKNIKANVEHIMAMLGLTPHASTQATKLSGGNKRKLSLAIALTGAPSVLVLDEPTSAVDAIAKRAFWKIIQDITPGRSVLLTTHSMEEADTLATRAAIISRRLLAVGTTEDLRNKYSNFVHVNLLLSSAPDSSPEEMDQVRTWVLDMIPGARLERQVLGGQIRFTIPGSNHEGRSPVAAMIELLERQKGALGLEHYSIGGPTLETVFLSVMRGANVQEDDENSRRPILRRILRL